MESGIIEGAITSLRKHYKAHFDVKQKIAHSFFHETFTVWRVNDVVHSVKVSNQGAV